MRKLNAAAAILTIVGGLNWGLVGLFKFDLVAAVFGGMQFGEVNLASRIVYTLVGLSAALPGHPAPDAHQHLGANPRHLRHRLNGSSKGSRNAPSPHSSSRRCGRCARTGALGRRLQQQRCRHLRDPDASRLAHDRRHR